MVSPSLAARQLLDALGSSRRGVLGVQPRQINLDRRALAELAVDLDVAAGLLDEAIDLRQAKPGAVTDFLGGEERLEGLGERLGVMPVPVSVTASMTYWPGTTSAWSAA